MAGSCGHEHHQHDKKTEDFASLYTLYVKIDLEKVQCLNEDVEGSGKLVFKPWDKRLDTTQVILLFFKYFLKVTPPPPRRVMMKKQVDGASGGDSNQSDWLVLVGYHHVSCHGIKQAVCSSPPARGCRISAIHCFFGRVWREVTR